MISDVKGEFYWDAGNDLELFKSQRLATLLICLQALIIVADGPKYET